MSICGGSFSQMKGESIEELEAKAILEVNRLVVLKKWQKINVESNAATMIYHLRGLDFSWRVEAIMLYAKFLARSVGSVTWECIPITANLCADWIAKYFMWLEKKECFEVIRKAWIEGGPTRDMEDLKF